ncbi:ABC transporter permease [Sedimenticola hydrogenitrophicus]|uniref:ABC transporter permease n=1 Tax=Sedimenticola hydrogenitrophicus TaxID=2967975 RepID=UPI0023B0EB00
MSGFKKNFSTGWADIQAAITSHHQITVLGWQDVATRYRRSKIGAWWLTINMAVLIGALGFVFGMLFQQPVEEYLPYLTAGFILWGFISTTIGEGCTSFVSASDTILQIRMPLFTHVGRTLWRNLAISSHNLLILPIVFLAFFKQPSWAALMAVPGLFMLILNLTWIMLIAAVVSTRFRDATQIIQNFLQVMFYLTPVIWNPELVPERAGTFILDMNPFYHLLQLVRAPLLGEVVSVATWTITTLMAAVGWLAAVAFLGAYRKRIPYWL